MEDQHQTVTASSGAVSALRPDSTHTEGLEDLCVPPTSASALLCKLVNYSTDKGGSIKIGRYRVCLTDEPSHQLRSAKNITRPSWPCQRKRMRTYSEHMAYTVKVRACAHYACQVQMG